MSGLLSIADLAYLVACQNEAMPDTCTLRTVTLASDGSGGWTEGTADTLAVPCRLSMSSYGSEAVASNQITPGRQYTLTIPSSYTLTPRMRVIKAGVTYEITGVNEGASWTTAARATLNRMET